MMRIVRSIADHIDLEPRQIAVVVMAGTVVGGILLAIAWINFSVWRVAHPDAPWWAWMFR